MPSPWSITPRVSDVTPSTFPRLPFWGGRGGRGGSLPHEIPDGRSEHEMHTRPPHSEQELRQPIPSIPPPRGNHNRRPRPTPRRAWSPPHGRADWLALPPAQERAPRPGFLLSALVAEKTRAATRRKPPGVASPPTMFRGSRGGRLDDGRASATHVSGAGVRTEDLDGLVTRATLSDRMEGLDRRDVCRTEISRWNISLDTSLKPPLTIHRTPLLSTARLSERRRALLQGAPAQSMRHPGSTIPLPPPTPNTTCISKRRVPRHGRWCRDRRIVRVLRFQVLHKMNLDPFDEKNKCPRRGRPWVAYTCRCELASSLAPYASRPRSRGSGDRSP